MWHRRWYCDTRCGGRVAGRSRGGLFCGSGRFPETRKRSEQGCISVVSVQPRV